MNKRAGCYSTEEYAMAVLMNGRPFIQESTMGRWVGFRWGKCEVSVQTESPKDSSQVWRTWFYTPTGGWDLASGWDIEILWNVRAVLDQKVEVRGKKLKLTPSQKFYGGKVAVEIRRIV